MRSLLQATLLFLPLALPTVHAAGQDLIQPASVSSSGGSLSISLSLEVATIETPDYKITTRAYNGTIPGPTIRLNAGDNLTIAFTNKLTVTPSAKPFQNNQISGSYETNLHFHGLHVDGDLPSDDSKFVVGAEKNYTYFTQLPSTHMPGTHWLHPHRHGSTALQVGGGASAAIIVDDPPGYLPAQVENAQEVIMVVQQMFFGSVSSLENKAGGGVFAVSAGGGGTTMVNGQVRPVIRTDPGQWMRLRIIFAAWDQGQLRVSIPGCEMQLLAKDGIYIKDFPRPISEAIIFLGGRSDIMVRCMAASTSKDIKFGGGVLATIATSANTVTSTDLQPWTVPYPPYLEDLTNTPASTGCICGTSFGGGAVNGVPFDPAKTLHESYLGAVVERNIDAGGHPYHQHVYPFQLVNHRDSAYIKNGDWYDTFDGSATIRYQPREFVSKIMVHCHRLEHEDEGMMGIEFVRAASFGQCTCTAVPPPLPTWAIIVIVVAGVGLIVGYLVVARWRAWFPFRGRKGRGMKQEEVAQDE